MLDCMLCRLTHRLGLEAAKNAERLAGVGDGVLAVPSVAGVWVGESVDAEGSELVAADEAGTAEVGWVEDVAGAVALGVWVVEAGVLAGGVVGGVEEGVGVGVGVGVGGSVSAWQLEIVGLGLKVPVIVPPGPPEVAAMLAGAMNPLTASPAAVTSMTPPANRPMESGRTRAKHMEDPAREVQRLDYLAVCPRLAQPLTFDDSSPCAGPYAMPTDV
jgi:hypothetical protein